MMAHRAKVTTPEGAFTFSIRGATGVAPLTPAPQDAEVVIEFVEGGKVARYEFATFSGFFHCIDPWKVQR
jgi:hypothetical protein